MGTVFDFSISVKAKEVFIFELDSDNIILREAQYNLSTGVLEFLKRPPEYETLIRRTGAVNFPDFDSCSIALNQELKELGLIS
jgi:hypothetical protein